ncbi:hypothetical protein TD95_005424 [Thielaviopsis punctulata]|uniref:Tetrapyrrole biosynthesis uroporphyrinogen III synthase domain-containing protein n=1 Tax=Thielaviopsis punctulata TaxID=72032 RepID=A0A0F4Z7K4_9PEZI|nr:hypothetical protein TD95_005424 [Thielaviopsis punctulata]
MHTTDAIPILLLKTPSTPNDAYEELFSAVDPQYSREQPSDHSSVATSTPAITATLKFEPRFVPVLQHRFDDAGILKVADLLRRGQIGREPTCKYGGLIFTSQRAVEAFGHVLNEGRKEHGTAWPSALTHVPFYSVGPATSRALTAIAGPTTPFQIFGDETGNGEALAKYMLTHYRTWYPDRPVLPPMLFCVGEQRRDIIPKTLMDHALATDQAIGVDELVVYGTGEMASFEEDLRVILAEYAQRAQAPRLIWVVVFSPTGCDALLRNMGALGPDGLAVAGAGDERVRVATIGPTTRAHLLDKFGYEPHVSAAKPSPAGIWKAIMDYMAEQV